MRGDYNLIKDLKTTMSAIKKAAAIGGDSLILSQADTTSRNVTVDTIGVVLRVQFVANNQANAFCRLTMTALPVSVRATVRKERAAPGSKTTVFTVRLWSTAYPSTVVNNLKCTVSSSDTGVATWL